MDNDNMLLKYTRSILTCFPSRHKSRKTWASSPYRINGNDVKFVFCVWRKIPDGIEHCVDATQFAVILVRLTGFVLYDIINYVFGSYVIRPRYPDRGGSDVRYLHPTRRTREGWKKANLILNLKNCTLSIKKWTGANKKHQ